MNDGRKITTPALWEQHRKELFEIFDREFYGRLPEAAKTSRSRGRSRPRRRV